MPEFLIGPWLVQPQEGVIRRDGQIRRIEPKAMSVLIALAEGSGATVSRADLLDAAWPRQEVSDDVLTGCISSLRRALGDDPRKHRYIETVPKRGYRLVAPVRPAVDPTLHPSAGSSERLPGARTLTSSRGWLGAGLLAVVLASVGWWMWQSQSTESLDGAREHSVAVLPFDVFSDSGQLVHFASGLQEELIHQLTANPGLHVIARTSSARVAEGTSTIREISERLGVRHVIEGSVRDTEDGMRITVQLIDAATDAHLWSRVFDAGPDNLVDLQEQVGEAVSRLVAAGGSGSNGTGAAGDTPPFPARHPVPEAAYRLFLLGEAHMRVGSGEGYVEASAYFSDATRIAPSYALAWSRLAAAELLRYQYADRALGEAVSRAERALQRALEIDPEQPEALATLGLMHTYTRQYRQAESFFERALERQPNLRFALHNYGFALWSQSKFEAALEPLRKALSMDPLSGVTHFLVADSLAGTEAFDDSMAHYRHCVRALPDYHVCALGLSTLQRLTGDFQGATESLAAAATLVEDGDFWLLLSSGLLALQVHQLDSAESYFDRAAAANADDYALLRGQLRLSLATGTLDAFRSRFEELTSGGQVDRDKALIGGLANFHAGDCRRALAYYEPHLSDMQANLVSIWDAEFGFSHAAALAVCYGEVGERKRRVEAIAHLGDYVNNVPYEPISAQRFLSAAYYRLAGEDQMAAQELDRLHDDEWPVLPFAEQNPVFR